MSGDGGDIRGVMSPKPEPSGAFAGGAAGVGGAGVRAMTPEEFSARLQSAWRSLWLIAAAVLGQRSDADDVLQEAAMIGLRKIGEFDPATNFAAWMGGIVRNVARNHARKRVRRKTMPSDPQSIDQSRESRERAAEGPEFDRRGRVGPEQAAFDDRVMQALEGLEDTARACLLLRTLKNLPYREISALLSIPEGTAMSHVHRARQSLRQRLSADRPERSHT